jgi:hypothetical protein
MHFIWEPNKPSAWTHVVVLKIDAVDSHGDPFDERLIWTRSLTGNRWNRKGCETWNEEGRFREACVPCDERGNQAVAKDGLAGASDSMPVSRREASER